MFKFIFKKIIFIIPTFLGITILAFALIRMVPGDPVMLLLGERGTSPELYKEMQEALGLHHSIPKQYLLFVEGIFSGDLGMSIISKRPVLEEFFQRFPATLELSIVALLFAVLIGIPIGIIAALKRNTWPDFFLMSSALVGYSMPIFWWGLMLILFFSVTLGLTPVSGRINLIYDLDPITGFALIDAWWSDEPLNIFLSSLHHLILPAIAMGTIPLAAIARMTRSSLLEVINEDYIRTAKSRGVSYKNLIIFHALRNALLPIVTVIGLMFGSLITGAILTETLFSWPGIGRWMVNSVAARDYPVIQGGIVLIALMIISVNLFIDFTYSILDPKLKNNK